MKKENSNDYKVGDIIIYYDMFYDDVGAVFDKMIRDASESIHKPLAINDTGTVHEYISSCLKLLEQALISHHQFSSSNHEITIGEFIVNNKKVFSHISKLSDYMIVSELIKDRIIIKAFKDGNFHMSDYIMFNNEESEHIIKLDQLIKSYTYDDSLNLWIKWVDENFENIKAGKVNLRSI
jgi:hypothetical protein